MPTARPGRQSSHLRHVLRGIVSRRVTPSDVDPLNAREVTLTLQQLDQNALTTSAREHARKEETGCILNRGNRNGHIHTRHTHTQTYRHTHTPGAACMSGDEVLTV